MIFKMINHKEQITQNIKYKKPKMSIEARDIDRVTNNLFNEIMQDKSKIEETPISVHKSKKTTTISETTCSRDTNDWVPPNNTILCTDSPSHSNDKGCSRQLFGTNIDSSNSTSSSMSVSGDIVGVGGRKKKKKGNKKLNKRNEKQSG